MGTTGLSHTTTIQKQAKEISDYKYALDESAIVAITDQKGIIIHVNDHFCKISKYRREELIGQDHRIINSGHHPKEFIKDLWTTIANGKIWRGEIKNKAKDGKFYWLDTTIVPLLNEKGKPFQYLAIRSDITDRKQAEDTHLESLKEISDYKNTLQNQSKAINRSNSIIEFDLNGIILTANDNFIKLFGYSLDEIKGKHHTMLLKEEQAATSDYLEFWKNIKKGEFHWGEFERKTKDGQTIWIQGLYNPIYDIEGNLVKVMKMVIDITERKKSEEQLYAVNKELEAFSYSVSHDLRAPLRGINGYAQILKEDYGKILDEEGNRIVEAIKYNAAKMGALIDDLLAFSRLGRKELQKSEVNMNTLIRDLLKELKKSMPHHASILTGKLHKVQGDYSLLYQVIFNLVSNAVKYSSKKKKPVIQISSKEKNGGVIFSVKDNGAGFDMKYADKLFGVFQRLHMEDEFEGTGVGLAVVQRIINKHGGKIWAEGKVNKGAAFYFSLPQNDNHKLNNNGQKGN